MNDTHEHKLVCTTREERVSKERSIKVGVAKCVYCDFEVDCPIKEHAHG